MNPGGPSGVQITGRPHTTALLRYITIRSHPLRIHRCAKPRNGHGLLKILQVAFHSALTRHFTNHPAFSRHTSSISNAIPRPSPVPMAIKAGCSSASGSSFSTKTANGPPAPAPSAMNPCMARPNSCRLRPTPRPASGTGFVLAPCLRPPRCGCCAPLRLAPSLPPL